MAFGDSLSSSFAIKPATKQPSKMPSVHVTSNALTSSVQVPETLRLLSKTLSEVMGKPEGGIMAQLTLDTPMLFQGSDEPCAFVMVRSIGLVDEQQNKKSSKALTEIVAEALQLSPSRVFLNFLDVSAEKWGFKSTVMSEFWA